MIRWFETIVAAFVVTGLFGTTPVFAQNWGIGSYAPPGGRRPAVSPYMNLDRAGNPAINYYGLVRPQFDTSRNFQVLQTEIQHLPDAGQQFGIQPGLPTTTITTGHPVSFFNYSHYFGVRGGFTAPAGPQPIMPVGGASVFRR